MHPSAGKCPTTHVQPHVRAPRVDNRLVNVRIAFLLRKFQVVLVISRLAATEVHFDEIKSECLEIQVDVLLVVAVKSHALADQVSAEIRSAGILSRIGINAGFQTLGMNIVHHRLHPVREAGGMNEQMPLAVPAAEKPVIYINIGITDILQALFHHGVGLRLNQVLADLESIRVPRAPSHRGSLISVCHPTDTQGSQRHTIEMFFHVLVVSY